MRLRDLLCGWGRGLLRGAAGLGLTLAALRPARRRGEPDCELRYLDGIWHLIFEFGYLQPGRTLWQALEFYVGARESGSVRLEGRVMADGLPAVATCSLELTAQVAESETILRDLVKRYDEVTNSGND